MKTCNQRPTIKSERTIEGEHLIVRRPPRQEVTVRLKEISFIIKWCEGRKRERERVQRHCAEGRDASYGLQNPSGPTMREDKRDGGSIRGLLCKIDRRGHALP